MSNYETQKNLEEQRKALDTFKLYFEEVELKIKDSKDE